MSPAAAVKDMNTAKGAWLLNIPWTQTPIQGSADPRAIIIGASTNETASLPNPVTFMFGHLTAYIRLTLTGLTSAYGEVSSMDVVSSRPFAGDWYYSLSDGTFTAREASRSMHITTSSVEDVWAVCFRNGVYRYHRHEFRYSRFRIGVRVCIPGEHRSRILSGQRHSRLIRGWRESALQGICRR